MRRVVGDRLDAVVDRLARAERLDRVAGPVAAAIGRARPQALVDLTSWIGQPLHPALTDLPIGFWTSAWVFDLIGGRETRAAARTLVGLGVVSAVPTVVTGLSDWAATTGEARRIGLVHAAVNSVGVVCYGASWLARRRNRHAAGVALGMVGATAATLAAYFGSHLVYRLGVGVQDGVREIPEIRV
ncbi:MAG TPA: DUF2231 domain-containing protein [Acidimicrobiales bacterium]